MKLPLILLLGILPFQPLLAQSPDYFGAGSTPGAPTPSTAPPGPPELAAAQTRYDEEVKRATAPLQGAIRPDARSAQEELRRQLGDLTPFILAAQCHDGGESAALAHLGVSLSEVAAAVLGEGDWQPRPPTGENVPAAIMKPA